MSKAVELISLALVGLLSGCATPFESEISTRSSRTQIAPDLFQVVFRARPYESPEKARDMALLKAAEVVRSHGFGYMEIVNEGVSSAAAAAKPPGTSLTSGSVQTDAAGAYFSGHTTYVPGRIYTSNGPGIQLLVRGFQGKPESVMALDAAAVLRSIREKYRLD